MKTGFFEYTIKISKTETIKLSVFKKYDSFFLEERHNGKPIFAEPYNNLADCLVDMYHKAIEYVEVLS